jgi:hypothetical protein
MTGVRESLEAAATALEAQDEAPAPEAAAPAETSAPEAPPDVPHTPKSEDAATAAQRARDESGRFAKAQKAAAPKATEKPEAPATEAKAATPAAPKPEAAAQPEAEKPEAPASWKPLEREHFFKAPPEVRQAILRREKEMALAMQESAPAKKLAQDFQQTVAPYASMLQADGVEPVRAIGGLLQMAATLRSGSPAARAQLIAHLVRSNGVAIEALDAELSRQPTQSAQQPQAVDPQAITQQVLQQLQQQRQQVTQQRTMQEVAAFGEKREFFDSVREDMADVMQAAARRGIPMTLEEAYTRACNLHPEVAQVLKQRQDAEAAQKAQAAAQKARAAATSARPQPAGVSAPQPKGIREALAAAAAKVGG